MKSKKDYIDRFAEQLRELDNRLDQLKAKSEQATKDMKVRYSKEIEELRRQKEALQEKFQSFSKSSQEAWNEIKDELEGTFKRIKDTLNKHF